MEDVYLRNMTGSEKLSLEKEYDMCQSWMEDDRKCTFIILSSALYYGKKLLEPQIDFVDSDVPLNGNEINDKCYSHCISTKLNEINAMIGDINLFLSEEKGIKIAEINLMIADPNFRKKGFGQEALLLILKYGIEILEISHFFAKITEENISSINLFKKSGFKQTNHSTVFKEITFNLVVSKGYSEWLNQKTCDAHIMDKNMNSQCMKFCFVGNI